MANDEWPIDYTKLAAQHLNWKEWKSALYEDIEGWTRRGEANKPGAIQGIPGYQPPKTRFPKDVTRAYWYMMDELSFKSIWYAVLVKFRTGIYGFFYSITEINNDVSQETTSLTLAPSLREMVELGMPPDVRRFLAQWLVIDHNVFRIHDVPYKTWSLCLAPAFEAMHREELHHDAESPAYLIQNPTNARWLWKVANYYELISLFTLPNDITTVYWLNYHEYYLYCHEVSHNNPWLYHVRVKRWQMLARVANDRSEGYVVFSHKQYFARGQNDYGDLKTEFCLYPTLESMLWLGMANYGFREVYKKWGLEVGQIDEEEEDAEEEVEEEEVEEEEVDEEVEEEEVNG